MPYQSGNKKLTTVRLDPTDYEVIQRLARGHDVTPAEALRRALRAGLTYLIDGEEEDAALKRRLKQKVADIDGASFIRALKKELKL